MKALVIFDSTFGNTEKIAQAIAKELETKAVSVSVIVNNDIKGLDLLVVGSPIIGWKPSEGMEHFLAKLGQDELKGIKAATFDTRVQLFFHGDAMTKIANALRRDGAEIIAESCPFYVKGKEGPLLEGEIAKATEWAKVIKAKM